jgi:hypothetical protein
MGPLRRHAVGGVRVERRLRRRRDASAILARKFDSVVA